MKLTVVIPTLGRDAVLTDTIGSLLALSPPPDEILVVDQSASHDPETRQRLQAWHDAGSIRWIRASDPSIPKAMNRGLVEAASELVLFLDDDIIPHADLVAAHRRAHEAGTATIVAGRVVQPWETALADVPDEPFRFCSMRARAVLTFMGGNFSIRRKAALELGGFDENFVGVAYRFEAEFADRVLARGGSIRFEPAASLHHLKAGSGGTRTAGDHLSRPSARHSVGEYYYLMRSARLGLAARVGGMLRRPVRALFSRYNLARPWMGPRALLAEILGFIWAARLAMSGGRYLTETGDARGASPR